MDTQVTHRVTMYNAHNGFYVKLHVCKCIGAANTPRRSMGTPGRGGVLPLLPPPLPIPCSRNRG